MKGESIMSISKSRKEKIKAINDKDIDYSDIPELDSKFWSKAKIVEPASKVPVSIRLDEHVVKWFKSTGKGYQSRINAVLSSYVDSMTK